MTFLVNCVHYWIVMYASLQEFEKVLKQKQVELELLEVKLAQKSVAVAQERENNMAERQCVSVTTPCQLLIVATNVGNCQYTYVTGFGKMCIVSHIQFFNFEDL